MYSTRQAARELGINNGTLSRYVSAGKVPRPKAVASGNMTVHLWTEEEVQEIRRLLPKIANGRKTRYSRRYSRKHSAVSTQHSVKAKSKTKKKK